MLIILILGLVAVSQFVGPFNGWADKYIGREAKVSPPPAAPVVEPEIVEAPKPPVSESASAPEEAVPVADDSRSEYEVMYDEIYAEELKKLPPPEIGGKYTVCFKSGAPVTGELLSFSDGRVEIKDKYGRMGYRIDAVSPSSYPRLFPKRAAKMLALRKIENIMRARAESRRLEAEKAVGAATVSGTVTPPVITAAPRRTGKPKYNPKHNRTPARLKPLLNDFAGWLEAQRKRMGGKIADRLSAESQDGNTIVYLGVSDLFRSQDYDFRFMVSEAVWKIWSVKCLDRGLALSPNHTHVVMVDKKGRIIGGSTPEAGSSVWASKK